MGIGYVTGMYDILRAEDLQKLDEIIQKNKEIGNELFAIAIYDKKLCEEIGAGTPIKSDEDRAKIMQYISGVDFTFLISSLDKKVIKKQLKEAIKKYEKEKSKKENKDIKNKEYKIAYVPGTYDLFHAGHLENLLEASKHSEKIIAGVKSDELVQEHKNKKTTLDVQERMEILRHFKFINNVYPYYSRDPHIANDWIKEKEGKGIDAIFVGDDLREDFKNMSDLNFVFTKRDKETMKKRSTTFYCEKLKNKPHKKEKKTRYINEGTSLKVYELKKTVKEEEREL